MTDKLMSLAPGLIKHILVVALFLNKLSSALDYPRIC